MHHANHTMQHVPRIVTLAITATPHISKLPSSVVVIVYRKPATVIC